MVFSKELGYDPDEWEECEAEQFMLFGFYTRLFFTITSIGLTVIFFWLLEAQKHFKKPEKQRSTLEETIKVEDKYKADELEEVKRELERWEANEESEEDFEEDIGFSKEEEEALEEWQREVARMEEARLRELEEHVTNGSGGTSDITTESQFIDRYAPDDRFSLTSDGFSTHRFFTARRIDATPPPSPPSATVRPDDGIRLANIPKEAANVAITSREQQPEDRKSTSTNGWEAPFEEEFMEEHALEEHEERVPYNRGFEAKRGSSGSDEGGFVKVYRDDVTNGSDTRRTEPEGPTTATFTFRLPGTGPVKPGSQDEHELKVSSGRFPISGHSPDTTTVFYMKHNGQFDCRNVLDSRSAKRSEGQTQLIPAVVSSQAEQKGRSSEIFDAGHRIQQDVDVSTGRQRSQLKQARENLSNEERERRAEAEIYVHDAIEYVSDQQPSEKSPSGFVVQEDLLTGNAPTGASTDPTSQMVRTNEVFERVEEPAIEIDDAMTYAPEIQSIEIPPDQTSLNSENLLEYFDQVAAECTDVFNLPLPQNRQAGTTSVRPLQTSQSISSIRSNRSVTSSGSYPPRIRKQSSLLSVMGVTSMQEMLLALTSLEDLSEAMRKAGLQSTNLIFGIDYTASNKYQGEHCFQGRSLHSIDRYRENPYQQVIKIMGRALAPFATSSYIPAYGFGDAKTGDWSVFKLKNEGECRDFDEVLRVYDQITPTISLSGPTNFAPLIYQAIEICEKVQDYHILVIVADGQVTNEKATRRAIVQACQHPLSIIVVGVGDGPWDMMRIFDDSLPKRPWDNFHFVEFHELMKKAENVDGGELSFAIQSLLEVPDQYNIIRQLGLLRNVPPTK